MKLSRTFLAIILILLMIFSASCGESEGTVLWEETTVEETTSKSLTSESETVEATEDLESSETDSSYETTENMESSVAEESFTDGEDSSSDSIETASDKESDEALITVETSEDYKITETTESKEIKETTETGETEMNVFELIDFTVSVPEGREPIILQLTDPQIIDSSKARTEDRLGSTHKDYWAADKKEERCYGYLREIITNTSPDLIIITGDIIYGEFDDNGDNMIEFVKFMESFNIPWAPVFGNHDNESKMGADWQSEQFENAENCLFLQRELTGNGNYTVGIEQGGELTRVFFMLDSNGCGNISAESLANGHTVSYVGFGKDQIDWYTDTAKKITNVSPKTRFSAAWHIQPNVFLDALALYDTDGTAKVFIDYVENRHDGDFGYIGAKLKGEWDIDKSVFNGLKKLGFDSIFVGHEHQNSASIVYEGVRLQYGMKSSAYDRLNYVDGSGNIEGTYYSTDTPWVGGSVIKLSEVDGTISDAYIYYCKKAGGEIDWDSFKPVKDEAVNGLQKNTDFTTESGISVVGVKFDESVNAYEVSAANQGKVKINVGLLRNKSKFTFTVYVPGTSTVKLGGLGEFAIRTKPNEIEPEGDGGSYIGSIDYNSSSNVDGYRIRFDEWQTFTVDISSFGEKCTEFAFVIANGNKIYLRDMTIE